MKTIYFKTITKLNETFITKFFIRDDKLYTGYYHLDDKYWREYQYRNGEQGFGAINKWKNDGIRVGSKDIEITEEEAFLLIL